MAFGIRARLGGATAYGGGRYLTHRLLEPVWVEWLEVAGPITPGERARHAADVELVTWSTDGALPVDFTVLEPHLDGETMRARLGAGHLCSAVLVDGRAVASIWARSDSMWLPFLRRRVALAPGEVYLYDSYTAPGHRRSGLTVLRRSHSLSELARRGFRCGRGYVLAGNGPGLAAAASAGWHVTASHAWGHLGPFGVDVVGAAGRRRLRFVTRGRDAEL